jgi:hypothetical protein
LHLEAESMLFGRIEPGESLHDEAEKIDECDDMTSRGRCSKPPEAKRTL